MLSCDVAVSSEYCLFVKSSLHLEAAERPQWPKMYLLGYSIYGWIGPGLVAICQAYSW